MRNVLITGGVGFVGLHLAERLSRDAETHVVLADNLQRGEVDRDAEMLFERDNVEFVRVDLASDGLEPLTYEPAHVAAVGPFDDVYHLAAVNGTRAFYEHPDEVLRTNISTLQNVLDWISGLPKVPRLMFTSSNEAYAGALEAFGALPIPTPEEVPLVLADPYNPRWSYGASKLVGEQMVIHTAKRRGIPAVIVRPHNFYGPRAGSDHVIPQLINRVIDRVEPFPLYSPKETRAFCYIADAVEAMTLAMEHATPSTPTFHIGTPEETAIGDLAGAIFDVAGWRPRNISERPSPAGSVLRRAPSVQKLERATGWRATTPLHEGLVRTFDWYRKMRALA